MLDKRGSAEHVTQTLVAAAALVSRKHTVLIDNHSVGSMQAAWQVSNRFKSCSAAQLPATQ